MRGSSLIALKKLVNSFTSPITVNFSGSLYLISPMCASFYLSSPISNASIFTCSHESCLYLIPNHFQHPHTFNNELNHIHYSKVFQYPHICNNELRPPSLSGVYPQPLIVGSYSKKCSTVFSLPHF